MPEKKYDVAVVGCGLMGSALAAHLAASGYAVAAWNRTHARAVALGDVGVTAVESLDGAIRESRVALVCTNTYDSARAAFESVQTWGTTALVNLASGTPEEAQRMADWALGESVDYLDGCIGCYPRDIGSDRAVVLVSGAHSAWTAHGDLVRSLGGVVQFVSEEIRGAKVLGVGMLGSFFIASLEAFIEGASYVLGHGVPAEAIGSTAALALRLLGDSIVGVAEAIERDEHDSDQASLETFAEAARSTLEAMRAAGHRSRLVSAAAENLADAERAGLGRAGISAQSKVLGPAS